MTQKSNVLKFLSLGQTQTDNRKTRQKPRQKQDKNHQTKPVRNLGLGQARPQSNKKLLTQQKNVHVLKLCAGCMGNLKNDHIKKCGGIEPRYSTVRHGNMQSHISLSEITMVNHHQTLQNIRKPYYSTHGPHMPHTPMDFRHFQ